MPHRNTCPACSGRETPCYPDHPVFHCDHGPCPFAVDLQQAVLKNTNFRTALWTGSHLQLTLMCIPAGGDIGSEMHPDTDQFLYVEQGMGTVKMGENKDCPAVQRQIQSGSGILVPAGSWHNVVNTGCGPLRLFSLYAPPQHPEGTVHRTKKDAEH